MLLIIRLLELNIPSVYCVTNNELIMHDDLLSISFYAESAAVLNVYDKLDGVVWVGGLFIPVIFIRMVLPGRIGVGVV